MLQDNLTGAQAVIDTDHSYIHGKKAFVASVNTGSLAGGALYKFSLTTPALATRKAVHLRPTILAASANAMRFSIYEDSASTGGTTVTLRNRYREDYPDIASAVLKAGVTAGLAGKLLMASTAGGNFGNQPNNDGVEIISDNAADTSQTATLWGTIHGATTVVVSEEIALTGTTQAVSTHTDWSKILGVELDGICAGTVTVREASGNATITTLATTVLSAGIATITDANARDTVLRHDANGASTKDIGVVGTAPDGSAISAVDALNGATEEDHGDLIFRSVTKLLIGDVESARECWIMRPEVILQTLTAGATGSANTRIGGGGGAQDEFVLQPATEYIISVTNGPTTASTAYLDLFFYEEDIPGTP